LQSLAALAKEMTAPPRAGRINPAWSPGFLTTFENMALNLGNCIDVLELDFLPICPPSLDHDAWTGEPRAGATFGMFADASTAEWIVLGDPVAAGSRAA
jgi:hypothetical protein